GVRARRPGRRRPDDDHRCGRSRDFVSSVRARHAEPRRMTADKIYLVGFMASGKSTIARSLAARLRWRAEDVDDLIEARERSRITDIFAKPGEPYFRNLEREMLAILRPIRNIVVATGGGTFAEADNRTHINMDGVSVWIDVPLGDLIPRIP